MGIEVKQLTESQRAALGASGDTGVLVAHVSPGGPGEQAELLVGDVIVELAGESLANPQALLDAASVREGQTIPLTVIRSHTLKELFVQIADEPVGDSFGTESIQIGAEIGRSHQSDVAGGLTRRLFHWLEGEQPAPAPQ